MLPWVLEQPLKKNHNAFSTYLSKERLFCEGFFLLLLLLLDHSLLVLKCEINYCLSLLLYCWRSCFTLHPWQYFNVLQENAALGLTIPAWRSHVQGTCSVWGMKLTGDRSSASAHQESLANAQVHVMMVEGDILEQQSAFILILWVGVPLKSWEDVLLNPSQHWHISL